MTRRFQFTIANMLWATLWVATGMAVWSCHNRIYWLGGSHFFHTSAVTHSVSFLCFVIAVGSMFGQQRRAILVATVCFLVVSSILYLMIIGNRAPQEFQRQTIGQASLHSSRC
jgi:hypothetical protein